MGFKWKLNHLKLRPFLRVISADKNGAAEHQINAHVNLHSTKPNREKKIVVEFLDRDIGYGE